MVEALHRGLEVEFVVVAAEADRALVIDDFIDRHEGWHQKDMKNLLPPQSLALATARVARINAARDRLLRNRPGIAAAGQPA